MIAGPQTAPAPMASPDAASAGVTFSVIIVNWNVQRLLAACLESLYAHVHDVDFEVVVVDNASSDGSVAMLRARYPQVRLIANVDNVGFAAGINRGVAASTGAYLWLLNPDTEITEDVPARLRTALDTLPNAAIVGPRLVDGAGTAAHGAGGRFPGVRSILNTAAFAYKVFPGRAWSRGIWLAEDERTTRRIDWVSGAAMMVRREVFEAVGGFDERYFLLCEDIDLCYRARRKGFVTYFVPETTVIHHEGSSIDKQDEQLLLSKSASLQVYLRAHHGLLAAFLLGLPLKANYLFRFAVAGVAYLGNRSEANRKRFLLVRRHFRIMS